MKANLLSIPILVLAFAAAAAEKPNIIIMMADDLGYGSIGCYGNEAIQTPNLDAMAQDGIRFTDFHSNGAVCSPTRAALLTGRYQQRTGITGVVTAKKHRHTGIPLEEITFAEIARQADYTTALFGKWHLGYDPKFNPVHQGFDEYIGFVSGNVDYHLHVDQEGYEDWWKQDQLQPEEGYATDLVTKHGVDFIQRSKGKPFLLYLAYPAPHYPYQGRNDPPQYKRGIGKGKKKNDGSEETYREMIEVMDEGIGRIRKAVADAGLAENTLLVFLSDNGPSKTLGSAGPLQGGKGSIFEGGHRVPAIVCWEGTIESGRVSDTTLMTADLFPTIASIVAQPLPDGAKIDGVDFFPYLKGGAEPAPRKLYWGIGESLAVRKGDYKLIDAKNFKKPQLYNLKDDLGETSDIAGEHPETVQEMLEALKAWQQDVQADNS